MRRRLLLCHALGIMALFAALSEATSWAQDSDRSRYYLNLRGHGSNPFTSSHELTGVHDLFGLSVGGNFDQHWGLELSGDGFERRLRLNQRVLGEYSVLALVPQVRFRYPVLDGRLTPYVIGGAGVAFMEFNDRKRPGFGLAIDVPSSTVVGTVGAGLEVFVADNVAAGVEIKYLMAGEQTVRINGVSRSEDLDSLYSAVGLRLFFPEHRPRARVEAQDGIPARAYIGLQLGAAIGTDSDSMPGIELHPEPAAVGPANYFIGGVAGVDVGRYLGLELMGGGYELRIHSPDRGSIGEEAIYAIIPQVRARYPVLDGRLVPYALAGVGAGYAEFNDRKATGLGFEIDATSWGVAATVGTGVEYFVGSNIAAGVEARYLTSRGHTVTIGDGRTRSAHFDAVLLTIGLRVYLFDFGL